MDEAYLFLNETAKNTYIKDAIVQSDHDNMMTFLFGLLLGLIVNLRYSCTYDVHRKLEDLENENESLSDTVEDLNDTIQELQSTNDVLTADAEANDRLVERLRDKIGSLQTQLNEIDSQVESLESANNICSDTITELQRTVHCRKKRKL